MRNKLFWMLFILVFLVSAFGGLAFSAFTQRERAKQLLKAYSLEEVGRKFFPSKKKISNGVIPNGVTNTKEIVVKVDVSKEIVGISPLIYGSNLEPKMESELDIEKFVRQIGITCFRFPGGEAGFRWKEESFDYEPRLNNVPFRKIDYVIDFCKRTNTQLVLQVNVASGTVKEAAELVSYLKKTGFPVTYWELGNEVYGDWDPGYMSADRYSDVIRDYAVAMKAVDPSIKIGMDWAPLKNEEFNIKVLKKSCDYIDFLSLHWYPNHVNSTHPYNGRIHPTPLEIMANASNVPLLTSRMRALVAKYAPQRIGKIELAFLEWDCGWDAPNSDFAPYSKNIMQWSLANAIFYADTFGQFANSGVSVAAQYDMQSTNFGLIRGWDKEAGWGGYRWDGEIIRPKAYALELFSEHFRGTAVSCRVDNSPWYEKESDWWADSYRGKVNYITSYACINESTKTISLALINKHGQDDYRVKIEVNDKNVRRIGELYILSGPSLQAQNDGNKEEVGIKQYKIENVAHEFWYRVPAHSVNMLILYYE